MDRNETERNERSKPDSDTEMDIRTSETDLNGTTYTAEWKGGVEQDKAVYGRTGVR